MQHECCVEVVEWRGTEWYDVLVSGSKKKMQKNAVPQNSPPAGGFTFYWNKNATYLFLDELHEKHSKKRWCLVCNACERATKHIRRMIRAGQKLLNAWFEGDQFHQNFDFWIVKFLRLSSRTYCAHHFAPKKSTLRPILAKIQDNEQITRQHGNCRDSLRFTDTLRVFWTPG